MINLFETKVGIDILIYLYDKEKKTYLQEISRHLQITYSYSHDVVNLLVKEGLMDKEKSGRKTFLTLTEKGRKIAKRLFEIKEMLE